MKKLRVGLDNYGLLPLKLSPRETLKWALEHGAEGVAFSGLAPEDEALISDNYLKDLAAFAQDHNLYLEWGGASHIPRDMDSWRSKDLFEVNRQTARQAQILGAKVVRSCSGGLMRWNPDNPSTGTLLAETAAALISQRAMLQDYGVVLAIETHFEFTTFELLRLFEMCDAQPGGYLGICLDTMNLLTMLENPLEAAQRILPYVVSTHIKDGALTLNSAGLTTFPTAVGGGVVELSEIIDLITARDGEVNLSVEDHGGSFQLPIFDQRFLAEFPELTTGEFASLLRLAMITMEKIRSGECEITPRDDWHRLCEQRIINDIEALKEIVKNKPGGSD